SYTLPAPLVAEDGTPITSAEAWRTKRRPELLRLFESQMFGRAPTKPKAIHWRVYDTDREAIGGLATRKQVKIYIAEGDNGPTIDLLLYIPNGAKQPVPLFMGLNFHGNQSIALDPA